MKSFKIIYILNKQIFLLYNTYKKGRVICDSFIYRIDSNKKSKDEEEKEEYLVDVDKSLIPFLLKYLKRYKLRSDVHLYNASKNLKVWSVWPSEGENETDIQKSLSNLGIINVKDPRCPAMGFRIIGKNLENCKQTTITVNLIIQFIYRCIIS